MLIYHDGQTPAAAADNDKDAIPAGFKAALKAWLTAQGPQHLARAIAWGLTYCAGAGAQNVAPERVKRKVLGCFEDWHPAPPVEP